MGCSGCSWNSWKYRENLRKHRVRFEDAYCVFDDPDRIEVLDDREDEEDRWLVTGRVGKLVLVVVYTERQAGEWIIPARNADAREEATYYAQFAPAPPH